MHSVEKDLIQQLNKGRITDVNVQAVSPIELNSFSGDDSGGVVTGLKGDGGALENDRAKALNGVILSKSSDAALIFLVRVAWCAVVVVVVHVFSRLLSMLWNDLITGRIVAVIGDDFCWNVV